MSQQCAVLITFTQINIRNVCRNTDWISQMDLATVTLRSVDLGIVAFNNSVIGSTTIRLTKATALKGCGSSNFITF